jgi:hypothetical protein
MKFLLAFIVLVFSNHVLSEPTDISELEGIYGTKGSVGIYPMYLKVSSSENTLEISRYQMNSLTGEKEWVPIDCQTDCETKLSSEADSLQLIPPKALEFNDIKCVFNQKNAICKITPKNNINEFYFAWIAIANGHNIYNEKVKKFSDQEFSNLSIKRDELKHVPYIKR